MSAQLLLVMPAGQPRDALAQLIAAAGAGVQVAQPAGAAELRQLAAGCDAVVHLPAEDPFDRAADGFALVDEAAEVASVAAAAGSRLIFCSSVLLYADAGEEELMANDPLLGPSPQLRGLADAELEVFGSAAEVILLRLGIVLAPGTQMSASLSAVLGSGSAAASSNFLPLLHRRTLAGALAALAGGGLHGGWDVVSSVVRLSQVAAEFPGAGGGQSTSDPRADAVWARSRRVTGAALREAGAASELGWQQIVTEALA
jgi:hypothetical protein